MSISELLAQGLVLHRQHQPQKAERFYRRVLARHPANFDALHLLGLARAQQSDLGEAIEFLQRAVAADATSAIAYLNLGLTLKLAGRYRDAVVPLEKSLALVPSAPAHAGLGDCRRALKDWPAAIEAYAAALALDPRDAASRAALIEAKRTICDWEGLAQQEEALIRAVRQGAAVAPLILLNIADDPALQCANARVFTQDRYQTAAHRRQKKRSRSGSRIRVGYFSSDFREHAVSYLIVRVLELHDRSQFEVFGISHGPQSRGPMRDRLEAAFDRFLDLGERPTSTMTSAVEALKLDIAVDLNCHTAGGRMPLFASRVAPIQVNFLGFPGTSGADFFDYAIVDPFVVPESEREHFSERLAYLSCYQPNDDRRAIGAVPSRREAGLPDEGFVFCCFNAPHKIAPTMFDIWMRMMTAVPRSILWLIERDAVTTRNLRREAERRGIDGERLIFAPELPYPAHLARHKLADLFLDTLPYNAHTGASDALWAGLPVLTCPGHAFAGRVAGSLLQAIGLPELIAPSLSAYEGLGIKLAREPKQLADIKSKLARNKNGSPLFDSGRFCRELESAFLSMLSARSAA